MKIFQKFGFGLVFILAFTVSAIAQTENNQCVAPKKVAVVNFDAFDEKETGIKELVIAYEKLDEEIKPYERELIGLFEKIHTLNNELHRSEYSNLTLRSADKLKEEFFDKVRKVGLLVEEYKTREKEARTLFEKRVLEVVSPIRLKINKVLEQFGKNKGYEVIFDIASLEDSLTYPMFDCDVTDEFIKYYNSLAAKQQ